MLKMYIKTYLVNSFIKPFKYLAKAIILFLGKLDKSFWLYINFCSPNNLIIKNLYLLILISKALNRLKKN